MGKLKQFQIDIVGKTFKYKNEVFQCKDSKIISGFKLMIMTFTRTIQILESELKEIEILSNGKEVKTTSPRKLMFLKGRNIPIQMKNVKFTAEHDALILSTIDGKTTIKEVSIILKKTKENLYVRRGILLKKLKEQGKTLEVVRQKKEEPKGRKPQKPNLRNSYTDNMDQMILSGKYKQKDLSNQFGKSIGAIAARKVWLESKAIVYRVGAELMIGDCVQVQEGIDGVIVGKSKAINNGLIVQIVNSGKLQNLNRGSMIHLERKTFNKITNHKSSIMLTNDHTVANATDKQIMYEYDFILQKKSVLSKALRDRITVRAKRIIEKRKERETNDIQTIKDMNQTMKPEFSPEDILKLLHKK